MTEKIKKRSTVKSRVYQIILHFFVWTTVVFTLFPVAVTLMLSLKSSADFQKGIWSLPSSLQFSNYSVCLQILNVNMWNSILSCIIVTFFAVWIASFAAYVFARFDFEFKNFLFSLIIALMMVPGVLTLTSSYLNVQQLGIYNTQLAVILPGIASNLVGSFFLFRTFMSQQPRELYESAQIDGANSFVCYIYLAVPLSLPVLMIQVIGIFAGQYNDYLWPMLVIEDPSIQMLMPRLKDLAYDLSRKYSNEGLSYALYMCSGLPLIVTTMFGLKYCINGDFASGLKL